DQRFISRCHLGGFETMRVLIVEDDPHMRKNLHEALARAEFSIDTAKNGREALSLADKKPYDLILLDVMMPGLDGYSVLKTLRQEGHEAAIFMITGMGAIDDRLRGFNDGADDYVVKPFSIAELMARIAAVMRRIKKSEHVLTVGELRLDIKNGQVERSGRMILLRRKECELLEYFMCHAGEVLS